ncbi:MAG: hypothetical protein ACI9ZT_002225 [Gammaproteobacteria bacterium]
MCATSIKIKIIKNLITGEGVQMILYGPFKSRAGIQLFAVLFITFNIFSIASFPAYSVSFESGDFSGNVDTTLTYGSGFRVGSVDTQIVGLSGDPAGLSGSGAATTGAAFSENSDDGNQNFSRGTISNIGKFNTEVKFEYKNIGLFTRFNGFYDDENNNAGDRIALSRQADRLVSKNLNLQDLYAWVDFNVAHMPASIRVGEQVISWGESTFIQNGINVINPFDVSKLRTPGSQVRDALTPVGMVSLSVAPTDALSFEGYYQYDWERTIIEPVGSYFSTNDFVGDGGRKVMLGFGGNAFGSGFIGSDRGTSFANLTAGGVGLLNAINAAIAPGGVAPLATFESDFLGVLRIGDDRAGNGGEFGIAFRYFSEELNDTEFGLFFINHHSRTPIISAVTGTAAGVTNAQNAAGLINVNADVLTQLAGSTAGRTAIAGAVGTDQYARTARYLIEYPEDIQRLGLSFNTQLPNSGIALQGEYTFIHGAPLQVDDVELLLRALCPISAVTAFATTNQLDPGCTKTTTEQRLSGFIERNVSQLQMTATQVLGPVIGANQGVLVGEVGITHVHNMPKKSDLRLNGAGTFTSGNSFHAGATGGHAGKAAEDFDNFADATSWGFRIAGRLTYNNFIGPFNFSPRFAFSHDVSGITPGPGGNFLEGRKALTLGVSTDYQNKWQADLSYTNFSGAGRYNLLNDRDFIAFNMSYAF